MSALRQAAEDYLRIRRALGFKLENAGRLLPRFLDYLESVGAETITTEHAVRWATLPSAANPVWWGCVSRWSAGSRATCRRSTRARSCRRPMCCPRPLAGDARPHTSTPRRTSPR